jgi:negative regulator of replication initiation
MQDDELNVMAACWKELSRLAPGTRKRVVTWLQAKVDVPEPATRSPIREHVSTPEFLALRTTQAKYLSLIALLSDLSPDPMKFLDAAEDKDVQGRSRRYFSLKPAIIEESGSGAKAVRIRPRHPLYADVNNSTESKKNNLRRLMTRLGYGESDIGTAAAALE